MRQCKRYLILFTLCPREKAIDCGPTFCLPFWVDHSPVEERPWRCLQGAAHCQSITRKGSTRSPDYRSLNVKRISSPTDSSSGKTSPKSRPGPSKMRKLDFCVAVPLHWPQVRTGRVFVARAARRVDR